MTALKLNRRIFIANAATLLAAPALIRPARAATPVRIGFVTPLSGPLAFFSEHQDFVMNYFAQATGGVIGNDGAEIPFEIVVRDSQSNPNRASEVTQELIYDEGVVAVMANATPETCNPVSDQCEINGVPCLNNDCPIEPWFEGRGGDASAGFEYTYLFSFDTRSQARTFAATWDQVETNKVVGGLWPNDGDGQTYARIYHEMLGGMGYTIVDTGRFNLPAGSYNAQISAFKEAGVEIVVGVLPPPEFTTFWNEAAQQGFQPKICMLGKALELPPAVAPFGERALGLSTDATWHPAFPFSSALMGITPPELAQAYEDVTRRQASFPLGSRFALIETMLDVLSRAESPGDRESVNAAMRATDYASITGRINFSNGIYPNTCSTPIVTTQWKRGEAWPMELRIVGNEGYPDVPANDSLVAIAYA